MRSTDREGKTMEDTRTTSGQHSRGLFAKLDGTPVHVLIIVGLALTLFAPLIINFKGAALASAQAEHEKLKVFKDLDLQEFKRQQDEERKKSPEDLKYKQAVEQRKTTPPSNPSLVFG